MTRTKTDLLGAANRVMVDAHKEGLAILTRIRLPNAPIAVATMVIATVAHAQTAGVTGGACTTTMLQNIASFILGTFGQTIAVLAIIGIGLAWMFGRVSIGMIAGVVGGIIIMFGASYIAETLTGGGTGGGGTTC